MWCRQTGIPKTTPAARSTASKRRIESLPEATLRGPGGASMVGAYVVVRGFRQVAGGVDGKSLRLLKAMRGQLGEASASRAVDAASASDSLGMDRGALDFHRSLHDLVRAGYLEEPAGPARAPQGTYLITFEGLAAVYDA